ncbi:MAG: FKBP-type peptidyl-prolyl cis-trans isomerase [Bacteroidales bacterium]|nr:FKBP-type peptidyl-prolyl cis-trans isomerase [Bacteroidales bacterium]HOK98436.1 FKBP-type peptidyl-prolyl cis-trans isomerase [Bacteroidales bacterium]HPO66117.1 FKBP-type peptidyl-prolyl cis-trans isomerase [Bacteroidales bacterium]
MKRLLIGFVSFALILSACMDNTNLEQEREQQLQVLKDYLASKNITFAGTDTVYRIFIDSSLRDSTSVPIKSTYYVKINYNLRLVDNENFKLVETNNHTLAKKNRLIPVNFLPGPALIAVNYTALYGIYRSLLQLQKNDTADFVIPFDWAFGSYYTDRIPVFSSLIFQVRVVEVIPDIVAYDKSFWQRWVVDSLNLSLSDTTEEVPVYIKTYNEGDTNKKAADYNNVTVIYKGWLTDGRVFTDDYDTITFNLGSTTIIKGFAKGVEQLNLGQRAKIFIPYYHAYKNVAQTNNLGQVVIPPYSSLIYEVLLYKINY